MRVKWTYEKRVAYPAKYKPFLWDYSEGKAPLERIITRIFTYGKFEDLKWLYRKYPKEVTDLSGKYPDIKRGVKYWIEFWNEKGK